MRRALVLAGAAAALSCLAVPVSAGAATAEFEGSISIIRKPLRKKMVSWRAGCPVHITKLRLVTVTHWGFDGKPRTGKLVVHGEVVKQCGFNSGVGAFGPGNRANATVGRAVRLILLHVAGAKPGSGDAATHGQPAKYTYCAAENLDGFLKNPKAYLPGTTMAFAGLGKADQRADVVAYLNTLADAPKPLPKP